MGLFVLTGSHFPYFFANSVTVSVATALAVTILAGAAGYALSRFTFRLKAAIAFLLLLTQMFPVVMLIPPIYRLMTPLGLTDSLFGLIVVYTAFNVPFATFLMQSFFDGIPVQLEEAAMIDGCTRFGALRRIILPLTLPGMAATLGFVFTAAWSELLFALMLGEGAGLLMFAVLRWRGVPWPDRRGWRDAGIVGVLLLGGAAAIERPAAQRDARVGDPRRQRRRGDPHPRRTRAHQRGGHRSADLGDDLRDHRAVPRAPRAQQPRRAPAARRLRARPRRRRGARSGPAGQRGFGARRPGPVGRPRSGGSRGGGAPSR